jgi:nucleoside-diphosphate-sugar epimerase
MGSPELQRVLLLGCGFLGLRAIPLARAQGLACLATTRAPEHVGAIERAGATAVLLPSDPAEHQARKPEHASSDAALSALRSQVDAHTGLLVSFPPDGSSDARYAELARAAFSCVYISSTGVYGATRGVIDERTPVSPDAPRAASRLGAEACWRAAGATVLRAAAIYGPGSGMHTRLRAGSARIAGDGRGYVSRVHVDDLAQLALAALAQRVGPETFVVADEEPAQQGEVVRYLAALLGLPVPPAVPLEQAPETLRHDRRIDASAIRARLGVQLRYPTYRAGFLACLAEEAKAAP